MAILKRVNKKEFDQYGWMFGFVPVYVKLDDMEVCVRNWIPEITLTAGNAMFDFFSIGFDPCFSIKLTGKINKEPVQLDLDFGDNEDE